MALAGPLVVFLSRMAAADAPSAIQRHAFAELQRTGDWSVRWDDGTGSPATVVERRLSVGAAYRRPRPFSPEAVATAFVLEHGGLFPMRPGRDSLGLDPQWTGSGVRAGRDVSPVVRMRQLYQGVPVEYGGYAISMSPDGKVLFLNGRFQRGVEVDPRPAITAEEGARIAVEDANVGVDSTARTVRLLVKRLDGRDYLVWEAVVTRNWADVRIVAVDAHDGHVVARMSRVISDPR